MSTGALLEVRIIYDDVSIDCLERGGVVDKMRGGSGVGKVERFMFNDAWIDAEFDCPP